MEKRTFGKTNLQVSVLGFGGAPIGFLETEQRRVANILNRLLDQGVNVIDTAAMYEGSEVAIGKAVSDRRDEYILVSKCGQAFPDLQGEPWSANVIRQTVDRALARLKTDHLDVMLLHSCDLDTLKKGEALQALVDARGAGKVRFVGYSGDNEEAAYAAELDDVAVIETSVNICDQANVEMVLPKTRENNVGVIAKRPVANAAWKERSQQRGIYQGYAQTYYERLQKMKVDPAQLGYEGEPSEVWPEIALRFTLAQPGVHTAIVGTTNPDHVSSNLEAARKGSLPDGAVKEFRKAFKQAESEAGETWLGQM